MRYSSNCKYKWNYSSAWTKQQCRSTPGIEPGTSCTQSRNHTSRPSGHYSLCKGWNILCELLYEPGPLNIPYILCHTWYLATDHNILNYGSMCFSLCLVHGWSIQITHTVGEYLIVALCVSWWDPMLTSTSLLPSNSLACWASFVAAYNSFTVFKHYVVNINAIHSDFVLIPEHIKSLLAVHYQNTLQYWKLAIITMLHKHILGPIPRYHPSSLLWLQSQCCACVLHCPSIYHMRLSSSSLCQFGIQYWCLYHFVMYTFLHFCLNCHSFGFLLNAML